MNALLTPDEVAVILRLKPKTVRAMIRRGDLPGVKIAGRYRVSRDALADTYGSASEFDLMVAQITSIRTS